MQMIRDQTAHWPRASVHFEYFAPQLSIPETGYPSMPASSGERTFRIVLARSKQVLDVPADKSIVEVLREHGHSVTTSCESGLCGSCRTRYLAGVPDHRDYILDEAARRDEILICCSRAVSDEIVLDL